MPVDVHNSIIIDRPVDIVAGYAMDPDNAPLWYVNINSVEWKTERPLVLGSEIAFVAQFLGKRLAYTYEIVTLEAGSKLVMRTAQGPFPMETTYEFEARGAEQTFMSLRNRGAPSGFSKLMMPLMVMAMNRANRNDLAALKRKLERG